MASKAPIFLLANLLFFALVSASHSCGNCGSANAPTPGTGNGGNNWGGGGGSPMCPRDALKLGVCADILPWVGVGVGIGVPPTSPCCSLIDGLVDLEAAVCLCTAIKANVLGINLNVPLALRLILNVCGKSTPAGFSCSP